MVEKLLNISIHCEDIWTGIENALFPQNIQRKLLFYLKNYLEKTSDKELEHVLLYYPKSLIKLIGLLLSNPNSSGMAFTAIFTVIFKMLNNPKSSELFINPFVYLLCLPLTGNRGTTLNYLYTFYPALVKQLLNSYPLAVYLLLKYSLNHTTKGIRDLIICDKYAFDKLLQQTLLQEDPRLMYFLITASGQQEDDMTYETWLQKEWPKEQHKLITPKYTFNFYQSAGAETPPKKSRTDSNSFVCTEKFHY